MSAVVDPTYTETSLSTVDPHLINRLNALFAPTGGPFGTSASADLPFEIETTPVDAEWKTQLHAMMWWAASRIDDDHSNLKTGLKPDLLALHRDLHKRLVAFGGEETGFSDYIPDVASLLARGQVWSGQGAEMVDSESSNCQVNSLCEYAERLDFSTRNRRSAGSKVKPQTHVAVAIGFALSKDGIWRQHSWLLERRQDRVGVVETTEPRIAYFGRVLTGYETIDMSDRFRMHISDSVILMAVESDTWLQGSDPLPPSAEEALARIRAARAPSLPTADAPPASGLPLAQTLPPSQASAARPDAASILAFLQEKHNLPADWRYWSTEDVADSPTAFNVTGWVAERIESGTDAGLPRFKKKHPDSAVTVRFDKGEYAEWLVQWRDRTGLDSTKFGENTYFQQYNRERFIDAAPAISTASDLAPKSRRGARP